MVGRPNADIADTLQLRDVAWQPVFGFLYMGSHWRHLANTTEPFVCGSDAAVCQITLTILFLFGFMRHVAIRQLFGARKYSVSSCIVSKPATQITVLREMLPAISVRSACASALMLNTIRELFQRQRRDKFRQVLPSRARLCGGHAHHCLNHGHEKHALTKPCNIQHVTTFNTQKQFVTMDTHVTVNFDGLFYGRPM